MIVISDQEKRSYERIVLFYQNGFSELCAVPNSSEQRPLLGEHDIYGENYYGSPRARRAEPHVFIYLFRTRSERVRNAVFI